MNDQLKNEYQLEKATDRIYDTYQGAPRHPSHLEIVGAVKGYAEYRLKSVSEDVKELYNEDDPQEYQDAIFDVLNTIAEHLAECGSPEDYTLIEEE